MSFVYRWGSAHMIAYPRRYWLLSKAGLCLLALSAATLTSADCRKDLHGEVFCGAGRCVIDGKGRVWCSRHYQGDARLTLEGRALCGIGDCAAGNDGQIFCSSEIGGAALVDSRGRVRCQGECEPASEHNCEQRVAGRSKP